MAITYKPYEKTSATAIDEVKLPYSVLADAPDLSVYVTKSGAETISGVKTFTSAPKMDTLENSRGNAVYHFNGTCAYFGQTTFPVCLRGNEIRPKYLQGGETTASPLALYDDLGNYVPTQSGDGTYYAQVENENGEVVLRSFKNGDTVDTSSVKVKKDGTVVLQGTADRPKYQKGGDTAVDIALKSDVPSVDNFVPNTRKVNGKALSADITLATSDIDGLDKSLSDLAEILGGIGTTMGGYAPMADGKLTKKLKFYNEDGTTTDYDASKNINLLLDTETFTVNTQGANNDYVYVDLVEKDNYAKRDTSNTFSGNQSVTGNLTVGGNLVVNGTNTTVNSTTLSVKDKLIEVASGNTVALTTPAGLYVQKADGTNDVALVVDNTNMAKVGKVVLDSSGNIVVASSSLQTLATRSDASALTNGNLLKWDGTNKTLVDSGLASSAIAKKTDIPSVGNGTLTIQKNGTAVTTFSANQSGNATANITVPTKVSELTNDSGYTKNVGTITGITMNGASKGTSGVVDLGTVLTSHQDISGKANLSGATFTGAVTLNSGGTIGAGKTLTFAGTSNTGAADIKFGTVNSKTPYFGYAKNQTDGTFLWSITGTDYATGLAIGGGSGNLLWKGKQVATVDQIPNVSNYATKTEVNAKYTKPSGGIPKTDLASAVQTSLGKADTALQSHQDISGKANLSGGNTFTGKQILTSPPSDNYSIDAAGYIKGSWGQFPSTGKATSNTNKVCVLDGAGWIYYRTPAEIVADGGGASEPDVITLTANSGTLTAEQLASAEKTDTIIYLSNGPCLRYVKEDDTFLWYNNIYLSDDGDYILGIIRIQKSNSAYRYSAQKMVTLATAQTITGRKTFSARLTLNNDLYTNGTYGTAGQVLTSRGSGQSPTWSTPSSNTYTEFQIVEINSNEIYEFAGPTYIGDGYNYSCHFVGYIAGDAIAIVDGADTELWKVVFSKELQEEAIVIDVEVYGGRASVVVNVSGEDLIDGTFDCSQEDLSFRYASTSNVGSLALRLRGTTTYKL